MKFGGKSLSSPEKVQKICKNIKKIYKNDKKLIIIVSAMGDTTNQLLQLSKNFCQNAPLREVDVLLSTGETQSSSLFAMALNNIGVPAKSFQSFQLPISTFGEFGNSKIYYINKKPLLDCLNKNCIAVVSGFQGINSNNEITTLGRGGSDTTAAAIGAAINHNVEIYSDFDGVCSGDPRNDNYKKIKNISFNSMQSMSYNGAKVLESRAAMIAKKFNLCLKLKKSANFKLGGSTVSNIESSFVSLSQISNLCQISIDFSEDTNLLFLVENVLKSLNNEKFYNFNIKNNCIQFYVLETKKDNIIKLLNKNLKLLV